MSNINILSTASLLASLRVFDKADFELRRQKSLAMVLYMRALLSKELPQVEIITPKDLKYTGCQTSLLFKEDVKGIMKQLREKGVICDEREPNVIRVAPTPLYNKFTEIYDFVTILKECVAK